MFDITGKKNVCMQKHLHIIVNLTLEYLELKFILNNLSSIELTECYFVSFC